MESNNRTAEMIQRQKPWRLIVTLAWLIALADCITYSIDAHRSEVQLQGV